MSCAENPSPKENKPSQILSILSAYRHRSATIPDGFSEFALDLESQLTETVSRGEKVRFILPAFPFKAPAQGNKRKTLGSLPDKAEELALKTLDGFADSIDEIYEGGATIVIVLDTSVDRDVLRFDEAEALAYHQKLKNMALSLGLSHLEFVCPGDKSYTTTESTIHLSVYESNNVGRLTLDLLPPSSNPDFITPWHGTIAVLADASVRIVDVSAVDMTRFEVITNHEGRPWLLREKSDLFNWSGMELDFEPLYPCGMLVRPKDRQASYKFEDVNMKNVRRLALSTAPLLLRGFPMEPEKEVFRTKARELGTIQSWPFGDILEVRENASMELLNVLTREAMAFHYDGCFKAILDSKTGSWIDPPPLFQMFLNRASSNSKGGLTIFASSRNLLPLLGPDTISLEELRKVKSRTLTAAKDVCGGDEPRPFIVAHQETGVDTFRFHEPWPESKGGPESKITIQVVDWPQAESDTLCEQLTHLMYDRRVAYRHQWVAGDFIFNDNAMTMHTRTAFEDGYREHWRVHVN